ncbi:Uncharacterised protein [Actinomyces viscosus]|uniref:Uncharacterized protein n=1 Tax=Actinomyces viscosus TaxID=1656 RepID=A0A448PLC5_ACTVI|nr:Uncharacterised protein [Actinomyces viscosus]
MMGSLLSSRALCGTAVALLLLSGCSPNGSMRAARVSASSTAAVARNVPLCDVAAAGDVERVLNQQIRMFSYERDGAFYASYSCIVYGFSEQQVEVEDFEVAFTELTTEIDLPGLYDAHTYSEAAALQRATRFTLDGTDSEGVTIPLETNNWAALWQYPDGTVLTVLWRTRVLARNRGGGPCQPVWATTTVVFRNWGGAVNLSVSAESSGEVLRVLHKGVVLAMIHPLINDLLGRDTGSQNGMTIKAVGGEP